MCLNLPKGCSSRPRSEMPAVARKLVRGEGARQWHTELPKYHGTMGWDIRHTLCQIQLHTLPPPPQDSFVVAWQSKHQYHKPGCTLTLPAVQASLFPLCGAGYDFMGALEAHETFNFPDGMKHHPCSPGMAHKDKT